jgi:uncharacterized membrane protein
LTFKSVNHIIVKFASILTLCYLIENHWRTGEKLRINIGSGLWLIVLVVAALIIAFNISEPRLLYVILALPFAFFLPGYSLLLALFPQEDRLGRGERVALSFGLSIVVISLIGIVLNYIWLGITSESSFYSIIAFILIVSAIAGFRIIRLREHERFSVELNLRLPGWGGKLQDRILSVILAVSLLAALGMMGFAIAQPEIGERYTEFYLLGSRGLAADYPRDLALGDRLLVTVGIVNQEHRDVCYRIEMRSEAVPAEELGSVMLGHEEKWEQEVSLLPVNVGENQELEFLLFKAEEENPCNSLRLWINVSE